MARLPMLLALCLALRLSSLAPVRAEPPAPPLFTAEVYARATNSFVDAVFFKPAPATGAELTFQFAPLILQEAIADEEPARGQRDQFGALSLSNGLLVLDGSRPVLYAELDLAQFNGKPHTRLTYLWCYSSPPDQTAAGLPAPEVRPAPQSANPLTRPPSAASADHWMLQGVRITLTAAGEPAVWEVLADESPAELVFVSQNLEAAAQAQFGKPLPGRRFALERSLSDAPHTIVARLLDDAPLPMGPFVYLRAGTRSVSTLICRCMASQAKRLLATRTYDLLPGEVNSGDSLLSRARARAQSQTAFWPGDKPQACRLESCLRLPASF